MSTTEKIRRIQLRENIESQCKSSIDEKITRYLEIEHQGIIGGHYFANASSECIYLYRDGYFIGAVMMSHAINEGIIKFVSERNNIARHKQKPKHWIFRVISCVFPYKNKSKTKRIKELIDELKEKRIISSDCAEASTKIWKSFRADIHHMNPTVSTIDFLKIAQQNLKCLSTIEREIFGHDINNGAIAPHQPKYWNINKDSKMTVFLRLE